MSSTARQLIFWVLILAGAVMLYTFVVNKQGKDAKPLPYGELVEKVRGEQIVDMTIKQSEVVSVDKDKTEFKTPIEGDKIKGDLVALATERNQASQPHVKKLQIEPATNGAFWSVLMWWGPVLLLVGFWIFMLRQMQSGGNKALSFGKSRAKLLNNQQKRVTFKDVAGVDEAKEELQEIIEFLKEPQKFQKLGGRIPKGVLLVGPPGTGKTLMARAVAGEANVPFFSISGSDFVEMFVGVGASRVRDLFKQAKEAAPAIVFIDELDEIGRAHV